MAEQSVPPPASETDLVVPPPNAEALIAKAIEHQVPVETMERLLALRDRLRAEQAREAFFVALGQFQSECPIIVKSNLVTVQSQSGGRYSYQFAPLDKIVSTVRPILAKHGLSYTFDSADTEGAKTTICRLHHIGGHSEASSFTAPIDATARMSSTHKSASAHTYAKRYAFCNALGILTGEEDDDAQTAGAAEQAAQQAFPPPKRTSPERSAGKARGDTKASGRAPSDVPQGATPSLADQLAAFVNAAEEEKGVLANRPEGSLEPHEYRKLMAKLRGFARDEAHMTRLRIALKQRIGAEFGTAEPGAEHLAWLSRGYLADVLGWLEEAKRG